MVRPAPKNDYERRLIEIVKTHGWQVTSVFDPEGAKPNFSYSIGILETLKAPELIIIGLPKESAHGIINSYGQKIRDGSHKFRVGEFIHDLIEGYDAFLIDITTSPQKEDFAKSAGWYYDRGDFPMMQLVWPSKSGNWPWQDGHGDLLRSQPLLAPPVFLQ
jgi:hypothetical protein